MYWKLKTKCHFFFWIAQVCVIVLSSNLSVTCLSFPLYSIFYWRWRQWHTPKFDVHVTLHRDKFLIIKPIRCTNFSNLCLEWNSTCFGQFLCPSSEVFHCTHSKPVWNIPMLCVEWKTPDDGQRNSPETCGVSFQK